MHTFPIVRDMDRAVRGTPSSTAGGNREENSCKFHTRPQQETGRRILPAVVDGAELAFKGWPRGPGVGVGDLSAALQL